MRCTRGSIFYPNHSGHDIFTYHCTFPPSDCSENVNGEIIIDLDFSTPTYALVKISYKGKREKIHIVDCYNKRVEVGSSDVSANLQDLNRWVSRDSLSYLVASCGQRYSSKIIEY